MIGGYKKNESFRKKKFVPHELNEYDLVNQIS